MARWPSPFRRHPVPIPVPQPSNAATAAPPLAPRPGLLSQPRPPLPPSQSAFHGPTVLFLVVIHVAALVALLPRFWSWQGLTALVLLYWITGIGVTLGLHRLAAHRSFQAPLLVERTLMLMGTLALQNSPIEWVGLHRHHHQFSDLPNDHHDSGRGFWWAHVGWMLHDCPARSHLDRYTADLRRDPFNGWLERWSIGLQLLLAAGLFGYGSWAGVHGGGLGLVLWGIALRLVLVYNVTWLVNSATHAFGYRNFNSDDLSRNCWWVALLALGEGWHNNHHAFPSSARHGLRWFEFDITWQHIRLLRTLGLARRVKLAPLPAAKAATAGADRLQTKAHSGRL